MAEDKAPDTPADPKTENAAESPKKLDITQEDLDRLIGKARTDAKAQSDKEVAKLKAEFDEKIKLSAMKEEERVKAEREMELKKLNDELAESRRALRLKAAEADLAKLELDPDFADMVLGKDDDATAANIQTLRKQ